ncbi:hypothetical protein CsSME_00043854 [Camellia sinensis var. sinensis]
MTGGSAGAASRSHFFGTILTQGRASVGQCFLPRLHVGGILGRLTRSRSSLQRVVASFPEFRVCLGVHEGRSQVDSLLDGHGTEEGDTARSPRHSDNFFHYTNCTDGDSSTSTGSTSSSSRGRGRDRGTWGQSSSPEPILSDDNTETSDSEEAVSQHSKSSESGDDAGSSCECGGDDTEVGSGVESGDNVGSGSGSKTDLDSGTDEDSALESSLPRKRTKRTSWA